jgi:hypothetical protein
LELNGQRKGIIPGVDVVAAYIAIWPGPDPTRPDPINEVLKTV